MRTTVSETDEGRVNAVTATAAWILPESTHGLPIRRYSSGVENVVRPCSVAARWSSMLSATEATSWITCWK